MTNAAIGSYFAGMWSVGLKMIRNRLSEYVRLAAGGETVLVTDRDRVAAETVPPQGGRSTMVADAVRADAVRGGWVTPPALVATTAPPRQPVMTFDELMRDLRGERDDR